MTTQLMPASPDLRRLTVAEYYAMADAGILTADDRVELLDGELVPMSPVGDWHYGTANWLNNGLAPPGLQHRATVAVQGPVRLDDHTEPQPDIALLRFRVDFCRFLASPPRRMSCCSLSSIRHFPGLRPGCQAGGLRPRRHP